MPARPRNRRNPNPLRPRRQSRPAHRQKATSTTTFRFSESLNKYLQRHADESWPRATTRGQHPEMWKKVTDLFSIQFMSKINQSLFSGVFFGTDAVLAHPVCITHLVQQSGLSHGRHLAPLDFPFRLPFLRLTGCFLNNRFFYTPQKPMCQRPFRVSTSSYA